MTAPTEVARTVWLARRSQGGEAILWAAGGAGFLAALALGGAVGREPDVPMVLILVLALLLTAGAAFGLAWGLSYRNLSYVLGEDALRISWLGSVVSLPYRSVEGIFPGQKLIGNSTPKVPSWPGIYVGEGRVRGIGKLHFFSTTPDPADLLLVTAQGTGLVLSARESQAFRAALIERVQAYEAAPPTASLDPLTYHQPTNAPWTTTRDQWAVWCASAALVLLFASVLAAAARFGALPERIPLRFDSAGIATEIGLKADLFRLPLGATLALVASFAAGIYLHPREKVLARMLWTSAAVLQAIVLVAVVRLLQ
jgi:hypothetical protein